MPANMGMEDQIDVSVTNHVTYSVCVGRILDEGWIRALNVTPIATHRYYTAPPRTALTLELHDQAALLGLLNHLHNLGLTLLSVKRDALHAQEV